MEFQDLEKLTRGMGAYERRFSEIYYYLYRASENSLTKDELDEYYKILKKRSHSTDHLVKLAEVYLIMGDKDTSATILERGKRDVEDRVMFSNSLILLECLGGKRPTYNRLAMTNVIAECSHLLDDYDPMQDFMRLLRDNPTYNSEPNISKFLQNIAMRTDTEPGRPELVEDALILNERVKTDNEEKIQNNYTLAVALRSLGKNKESEKFIESLREGLKKSNHEFDLSALSLVSYHSIFKEIDEVDKLIDTIEIVKQGGKQGDLMLRAISASTAYVYTENQRYLDIALEAFHKSKGTEKTEIGIWFMNFLDRSDILFDVLDEILKEGAFLFYTDRIAMALGKAYASVKDRRILRLMDGALFYRNVLDFILNLTGESLSKRFKMNFYFF